MTDTVAVLTEVHMQRHNQVFNVGAASVIMDRVSRASYTMTLIEPVAVVNVVVE